MNININQEIAVALHQLNNGFKFEVTSDEDGKLLIEAFVDSEINSKFLGSIPLKSEYYYDFAKNPQIIREIDNLLALSRILKNK